MKDSTCVITLIKQEIQYDELGVAIPTETKRYAYAHLNSIGQKEYWSSTGQHDFKPECVAGVFTFDYDGETLAEIDGKRFQIYRSYRKGDTTALYLTKRPREGSK